MNIIDIAHAAPTQQEPSAIGFLLPIFILILMYFILIRPQSKKMKEHKQMLNQIKIGDEISTAGGILGKIIKVGDSFVEVQISEGVLIKLQKSSVSKILPKNSIGTIK
tara:strand:- start:5203 stop:5526 length:324 start_codon:yes stop_codon:yes gene_type:complete